jgi:hypothetical protein
MTPEVQVLLINAAALALAYGLVYPRLVPLTLAKLVIADVILTAALLGVVVYLFSGTGMQFWLFGWMVDPVLFALITLLVMEMPLFSWFADKHDIGI